MDFSKVFDEAMKKSSDERVQMTKDEEEKFAKAVKDPEFCKMLAEYMEEISDPKHREEHERYLAQLEAENKVPTDKQLVVPEPGFVVKVKTSNKCKVFINICSSEKIDPPTSTPEKTGSNWQLPYSLGPKRVEKDKNGVNVSTFDVCFHPQTVQYASRSESFKKMVIQSAKDGVQDAILSIEKREEKFGEDYHILRGVRYKSGQPVTMCISKKASAVKKPTVKTPKEATTKKSVKEKKVPNAHIVQRGNFDLADHLQSGEKKLFRPRELVLKIELPKQKSAAGVDLDVSEQGVKLLAPGYDLLEIDLPYHVFENKGKAKFDKTRRILQVTLPVVPPPAKQVNIDPIVQEEEEDDEEDEEIQTQVMSNDDGPVDHSRWVSKDSSSKAEFSKMIHENSLMSVEDYLTRQVLCRKEIHCPEYTIHHAPEKMSILLPLENINANSVKITYNPRQVNIHFNANRVLYQLDLSLEDEIDPEQGRHDVNAKNMIVVMKKCQTEESMNQNETIEEPKTQVVETKSKEEPENPATQDTELPVPMIFQNDLMYELD